VANGPSVFSALGFCNVPPAEAYDVEVYRSTAGEVFQPLWQHVKLPREYHVDLAPLEAVFVELCSSR